MQYCPRCRRLCADICPGCGRTRGLRPPEPTDPVRLIAADFMQAMLIEPVLEQNGVAYAKAGQMGEGLKLCAGPMMETFTFYVAFSAYERSRSLLEEIFDPDGDIAAGLRQNDLQGE